MGQAAKRTRENRTITVDFRDQVTYVQLLGDGKAFIECVLACLLALGFPLRHMVEVSVALLWALRYASPGKDALDKRGRDHAHDRW